VIFLSVGTQFPFDRLVKAVDEAVAAGAVTEPVFAQIGEGSFRPANMEWTARLTGEEFEARTAQAGALIGHAGVGLLSRALALGKPLLVMPRRKDLGEHVNDHQLELAGRFAELGHVLCATDVSELEEKLPALCSFSPTPRESRLEPLSARLEEFFRDLRPLASG
jgi:UDP-N-acetylglucosamine transferase subunit ALG13